MKRMRTVTLAALMSLITFWVSAMTGPPAADAGTRYPYRNSAVGAMDRWGFYTRYCTSYVAYRLDLRGIRFRNATYRGQKFGNAKTWDEAARRAGIKVNRTPKVGAVAVWGGNVGGGAGHVAVVAEVSGGKVTVHEYNFRVAHGFGKRVVGSVKPDAYIHF